MKRRLDPEVSPRLPSTRIPMRPNYHSRPPTRILVVANTEKSWGTEFVVFGHWITPLPPCFWRATGRFVMHSVTRGQWAEQAAAYANMLVNLGAQINHLVLM